MNENKAENKELSLYIHVPFCRRKCNYCDFCSFTDLSSDTLTRYAERVREELKKYSAAVSDAGNYRVPTVYFGGGTPSLLAAEEYGRILDTIGDCFELCGNAEITLECNPATADGEYFQKIRGYGVNRLSLGLQSAVDKELLALGRIHSFEDFKRTYSAAREAGFDNISADLMYGIPNQTLESFERSLSELCALAPEHISSYLLKIEEGTAFWGKEQGLSLPDEDTQLEMYLTLTNFLREKGYDKYEISNFARRGFESRHNSGYWQGREYIGIGVAAYSYFAGDRFGNSRDLGAFLRGEPIECERESLSAEDALFESIMLGMRMARGISLDEYAARSGADFDADFPSAARFERLGLLARADGRVFFTDRGFFLSNAVLSEFLSDFSKAVDIRRKML